MWTVAIMDETGLAASAIQGGEMANRKKLTLYISEEVMDETKQEALRQDRSMSWIMEVAWKIARQRLQEMPGIDDYGIGTEC